MSKFDIVREALYTAVTDGLHESELPEIFEALNEIESERKWISVSERLPDDKIDNFTGGPEGSWGLGVLIITTCGDNGIERLFGYYNDDDGCFWAKGRKVEAACWMPSPPEGENDERG